MASDRREVDATHPIDGADLPAVLRDMPLYDWQIRAIQQWRDAAVAASSHTLKGPAQ